MLTNKENLLEEMVSRDNFFFDISKLEAELVQIMRQEEASLQNINIAKGTTNPLADCFWLCMFICYVWFGRLVWFGRCSLVGVVWQVWFGQFGLVGLGCIQIFCIFGISTMSSARAVLKNKMEIFNCICHEGPHATQREVGLA